MEISDQAFVDTYRWARRLALLICHDPTQSDDLVQEAFLKLLKNRGSVRDESLRPWLRTVMVRIHLRHRWRQQRERQISDGLEAPQTQDRDPSDGVLIALGKLSAKQRACIVLRYFEDLPESDIAGLLGIANGTVKAHLAEARARLRSELSQTASMD